MKPFCDPDTATSTPQESISNFMEPIELTPSTKRRAGWFSLLSKSLVALTSLVTPVDVSFWVTNTALIS